MKFSKAPPSSFFSSWYFLLNSALILTYPIVRFFTDVGQRNLRHLDSFGFTYQNSIIYTGLAFIGLYYIRSASMRQFLLDCLTIGKIVVISLLFFAKFQLCIVYFVVSLGVWIMVPYPRYTAPNKFIKIESVQQFDELVGPVDDSDSQDQKKQVSVQGYCYRDKQMFFLQFYVDWLLPCNVSKQLWYAYSNRYTTPSLRFLQINVSRLPELAKRYSINISGFTKQLPTTLIIQNGKQKCRFPPIKEDNKVDRVVKLDYKILLKYFDLQSRYLETRVPSKSKSKQQ